MDAMSIWTENDDKDAVDSIGSLEIVKKQEISEKGGFESGKGALPLHGRSNMQL